MSLSPPSYPPPYGPGSPSPRPVPGRPLRVVFVLVAVLLLAVALAVNGVLFFGTLFAGDSCGTSAGTQRFCDGSGWQSVAMYGPTVALAAAVVTVVLGAVRVRRPWAALALGVLVYAAGPALALFTVFA